MRSAVIVSTARTPIGRAYRGAFNDTQSQALGGHVIAEAVKRAGVAPAEIDDVVMGAALQQGAQGFNIARQCALRAGLPDSVAGMTVDRQCSSGLMAIATAAKQIIDDDMQIAVGGGLEIDLAGADRADEPLSRAQDPELVAHVPALYMTMIETAEIVADRYNISREAQDEYALRSQQRTAAAQQAGRVRRRDRAAAVRPCWSTDRATGDTSPKQVTLGKDEGNRPETTLEGLAALKPVFKDGQRVKRRQVHHRRQRLATVRWRVGRGADGGEAKPSAAACTRSASIAAWRWPAARRTRWASARCSRCRSCWRSTG